MGADSDTLPSDAEKGLVTIEAPLQFRLTHVVYVVSLLAAALAAFGAMGILWAAIPAAFWFWVFWSNDPPKTLGSRMKPSPSGLSSTLSTRPIMLTKRSGQ
jgi:hypothetical protein